MGSCEDTSSVQIPLLLNLGYYKLVDQFGILHYRSFISVKRPHYVIMNDHD